MKDLKDIKQSDNWGKYLSTLGFYTRKTSGGVMMEFRKLLGGSLAKIQHPQPLLDKDLQEIELVGKKEKALMLKLEPYVGQDESLLIKAGYFKSRIPLGVPSTIYIDLEKSEEELWNNISHSGKYSIKRAEREGAQIKYYENPPEDSLVKFYEIFKETAKKKKFYMIPLREALARTKAFGREAFLIAAYDKQSNLAGAKLFLGYDGLVLYSLGGTSELGRKNKIGYELVWKSILYFKGLGYKTMDLEGKDDRRFPSFTSGWEGFSHFKEKFGGETITFPYPYVKFLNPVLNLLGRIIPFGL